MYIHRAVTHEADSSHTFDEISALMRLTDKYTTTFDVSGTKLSPL